MCCGGRLQGARRQIDGKRGRITPEQGMLDTPPPLQWQSAHLVKRWLCDLPVLRPVGGAAPTSCTVHTHTTGFALGSLPDGCAGKDECIRSSGGECAPLGVIDASWRSRSGAFLRS